MARGKHSGLTIVVVLLVGYVLYEWFKAQPAAAASSPVSGVTGVPGTPLLSAPAAPVGVSQIHQVIGADGSMNGQPYNEALDPMRAVTYTDPTTGTPEVNPVASGYSGAFSTSSSEEQIVQGLFPKSYAFGGSPLEDITQAERIGGGGGGGSISRLDPFAASEGDFSAFTF